MKFLLTLNVNVFEALDDFIYDGDKEIFLTTTLACLHPIKKFSYFGLNRIYIRHSILADIWYLMIYIYNQDK